MCHKQRQMCKSDSGSGLLAVLDSAKFPANPKMKERKSGGAWVELRQAYKNLSKYSSVEGVQLQKISCTTNHGNIQEVQQDCDNKRGQYTKLISPPQAEASSWVWWEPEMLQGELSSYCAF